MIHGFVHFFVSLPGVVLLAALDSTFFFTLPLGIDAVVVLLASRGGLYFWLTPGLATAGSLAGAALTYWTGAKIGEAGVKHFCPPAWLERVQRRLKGSAVTLAALDLMPPPFPFTPFVLASGAIGMNAWSFLGSLAAVRVCRFGVEALLAHFYGSQILRWMRTPTFKMVVGVFIVLAVIGTVVSAIALYRSSRTSRRGARPDSAGSPPPPRMAPAARGPR